MRKFYKLILTCFAIASFTLSSVGQNKHFSFSGENANRQTSGKRAIFPQKYAGFTTDINALKTFLWTLPSERSIIANRNLAPVMEIPMPNGTTAKFRVWESNVMEPGFAAQHPEMRQFLGQGIDDPYASIRFDYNPYTGFHGQILSSKSGRVYIDPYANGDKSLYMSYSTESYTRSVDHLCKVIDSERPVNINRTENTEAVCLGANLRTYRLALACTEEYSAAVAGPTPTVGAVAAAMLTSVNRVTGVYEKEVSLRMVLVANNNNLIYITGLNSPDPYTNNNGGAMLSQNITNINNIIGAANYDIGHVFSTGGGGVAFLNSPCTGNKAGGVTGLPNPVGDAFDIDFVAHEMGHQWGGNHSFNGQVGNCSGGNRNGSTAYEPGSGTTIQAYAGICGSDDIQPNSDPHFHGISFDEISNFITTGSGNTCGVTAPTGNTLPVINPLTNSGLTIPISTPFTLSGSATDGNGDALTYSWEQWDLGPQGAWNGGATAAVNNTLPLFKARVPKTTGERTFPDIAVILAGYPANPLATLGGLKGETLSPVARVMNFRLTVRDNRAGGGGVVSSGGAGCQTSTPFVVNVAGTAPFAVTVPNGGESYAAGSTQTITWNVVGTNAAPFNVANVRITMSTDGGLTYPNVITNSTPNDGSEALAIPSVASTTTARVKVEAVGNIFFDVSNANFSVTAPLNGFTFNSPAAVTTACPAPNPMTSGNLTATYVGAFTGNINLTAASAPALPGGATITFGISGLSTATLTQATPSTTVLLNGMQNAGPGTYTITVTGVGVAGPTVTRDIVFTINPGAGPTITGQPASVAVCSGANTSFSVTATGTYQWQISTIAVPAFTNIGGATSATLNLTGVTAGMSGNQYRCIVTGQCGSTPSNAATLTVNVAPAVTTNPTSLSVCSGSAVSFTAAASGTPTPTYQWQVSTTAVPAFTNIGGATSPTYNIASTTLAMNNDQYRCVITNICGSVNTMAATLIVSSSITISSNPVDQTVCEATNTSFTVAAAGSGLLYQWEVSVGGGAYTPVANGGVYSGATSTTLSITGVPPSLNGNRYRCVVSNGACTPGVSTGALLTVNTFPVITTQPANITICEGAAATFSVTATTGVGSLSYQWQLSTNGGTTYNNITGATASSFAQAAVPVGQNGYRFRVIVTAGCGSVTSNGGILTVNAFPVITFSPVTVVCLSDAAFSLSASPSGGAFSGAGVSGSTFTPSVAGVGPKAITYTVSNAGCQSVSTRTILVNECAERHLTLSQYPAVIVYPVPNNGNFSIRLNTDLYTKLNIKLYNNMGQLVKSEIASGLTYGSIIPIQTFSLPNGTYQLFLTNDERGEVSRKGQSIIIQKF